MLKTGNKKLQDTSKNLDLILANQKGIRKRLDESDYKGQPLRKKKQP